MATIQDQEFGTIAIRRSARSRQISIRIAPGGGLRVSAPLYTPTLFVKRLLEESRSELRGMMSSRLHTTRFTHGMQLGRSHSLAVVESNVEVAIVRRERRQVIVEMPYNLSLDEPDIRTLIQAEYKKILRIEAKAYLPRRLFALSTKYGFSYKKVRYSHASGRWGSCSSAGTISLNIALMKLPLELIDYVLIHELCHTKEMNHSQSFWTLVEACCPEYKALRRQLKQFHPYI